MMDKGNEKWTNSGQKVDERSGMLLQAKNREEAGDRRRATERFANTAELTGHIVSVRQSQCAGQNGVVPVVVAAMQVGATKVPSAFERPGQEI